MHSAGATGDTAEVDARVVASRAPVDPSAVLMALHCPGRWQVRCVEATGSTNDDLAAAAAAGAGSDSVLIAELQTAGRGRRGRTWTAPAGAGLTMSLLVEAPEVASAWRGWMSGLAGVALVQAIEHVGAGATAVGLKWPNDLIVNDLKCAGLLAQLTTDGRFVVGFGINVSLRATELPRPDATSLLLAGVRALDRAVLAAAVLDSFATWLDQWRAAGGDPFASGLWADYERRCVTLNRRVRAELADGAAVVGTAVSVAADGGLVIDVDGRRHTVTAADVHHLRPADHS